MNKANDLWQTYLDDTFEAVCKYASLELDALARRTLLALQKMPASEIFGDYPFETIWDEYCHEVQQGPTPMVGWALDETMRSAISSPFRLLPKHVGMLIYIGADYELNNCDDMIVGINEGSVVEAVKSRLDSQAGRRNMNDFDER